MMNLSHSASFESEDKDAPSKPGIKHMRSNWEGVGVRPDVRATLEDARATAVALAKFRAVTRLISQQ
jgi:hypothetical protein